MPRPIRIRTALPVLSLTISAGLLLAGCAAPGSTPATSAAPVRTIVFVWDGLRPDSVSAGETPNLWQLRQQGVWFADNHSTYPTFTMMNASAFATGSFPATTGFYGNTLWQAGPKGPNASAAAVDFNQPVFTEDWSVLDSLNAYYGNQLYLVGTLFQAAQAKGLVTATVGKTGAAYIQDYRRGGYILDENLVVPQSLAAELQAAGFPLPKNTPNAHPTGAVKLTPDNGDPTGQVATVTTTWPNGLKNGDPSDTSGAKATAANAYMMKAYLEYILPNKKPDLSVIWFRDPDTTQHAYGPGSGNYHQALRAQDQRLGELLARLKALGWDQTTNVIVATDHAHSNVSGPPALFPLRAIANGKVGAPDPRGYSTSGDVRTADLITRARLGVQAFDGAGCQSSAMAGLKADGTQVYPLLTDTDGSVCGKAGTPYQTRSYVVPATLPANAVVIAANGGSDYLYVPSHDAAIVGRLVRFLQTRTEYGAIFVASRYGAIPGTIPMTDVKVEGTANRNPDIVVSFDHDPNVVIAGLPGIEFESFAGNRGMHGSFSPIDVHNALIVSGPSFRSGIVSDLPSGNVDLAPTLAYLLGTSLPKADGRVLIEALKSPPAGSEVVSVTPGKLSSAAAASGLKFQLPTHPDGADVDASKTGTYAIDVYVKDVKTAGGKTYRYFDHAKATRQ
jgi:predicted AlkP superfamily pyrophosphatase or phosphodiesterase